MKKKFVFGTFLDKLLAKNKESDHTRQNEVNEPVVNNQVKDDEKNEPVKESEPKETIADSSASSSVNNSKPMVEKTHTCCMCGAPDTEVNLIIKGGSDNYICERCAGMIHYQMSELFRYAEDMGVAPKHESDKEGDSAEDEEELVYIPTPHQIKEYLDDYVIGQDDAKIKLAVAVYNHYKRVYQNPDDEVDIEKSNCIILGSSGCGKSYLVKTISKLLDVPMTIVDANCFTQAGYVGEDVESILSRLYQAADGDIEKAERGIVFVDEIDKIAKQGDSPSITKDVSGEGVQQALLKIIEGSKVRFAPNGGRKHPEKDMIEIDTKNILFICSGAFVGIEKRIGKRLNTSKVGFKNSGAQKIDETNMIKYLTAEDIRSYGMIPELVGRLPVVTYVENLDKHALKRILIEPKNSIIKQYQKLFEMDGVKLIFDDEALNYIVERAAEMKVGARGLRSIVEEIMTQYMFDIPSMDRKRLTITKKYATKVYESKLAYKNE